MDPRRRETSRLRNGVTDGPNGASTDRAARSLSLDGIAVDDSLTHGMSSGAVAGVEHRARPVRTVVTHGCVVAGPAC